MGNVLLLVSIPIVAAFVIWFIKLYQKRQENNWRIVAEGAYERSEVVSSVIAARRVAKMGLMVITTIFFQDGKTWPILGVLHNPPAPGTMIRVYKNGLGQSRIEIDQAA